MKEPVGSITVSSVDQTGVGSGIEATRWMLATSVSLFHLNWCLPGAYLAVDLFFVISGLMIGRRYEAKLRNGERSSQFVLGRAIRLYPLYLLSIVLGLLGAYAQSIVTPGHFDLCGMGWRAILLLPAFQIGNGLHPLEGALFPMNPAVWSLWCEIVANIAFLIFCRLPRSVMFFPIVIAFAALGHAASTENHLSLGGDGRTLVYGLARVGYSFFVGVLLSRLPPLIWRGGFATATLVACFVMIISIFALWPPTAGPWAALPMLVIVSPCLAILCASIALEGAVSRIALKAGAISYAMYILHIPLQRIAISSITACGGDPRLFIRTAGAATLTAAILGASWVVTFWFDAPIRAWLDGLRQGGRSNKICAALVHHDIVCKSG